MVSGEVSSVNDADKFRRDIVRDLTKKISAIQNGKLLVTLFSFNIFDFESFNVEKTTLVV